MSSQTITLAGGCFWCLEAVLRQLSGVQKAVSGFINGHVPDPTYEQVCTGMTGHAEAVQVTFNPALISLDELLEVFFASHDPTTLNRQGNDIGTQYRSGVFYDSEMQRDAVQKFIAGLEHAERVVTEVTPADKFYPAEAYHQDYYANNTAQPYCQVVIAPKIAKLRKVFPAKVEAH